MGVEQTVEYDADAEWVQAGDSSWLPQRFLVRQSVVSRRRVPDVVIGVHVEMVHPAVAAGVTLYDAAWSTAVARSVEVATVYGEVQEKDLKAVRILDLLEAGATALGQGTPQPPHPGQLLQRGDRSILRLPAPPAASTAAPELRQARKVLRQPRVDLDVVSRVYTEAQQQGRRDPTIAVAEHTARTASWSGTRDCPPVSRPRCQSLTCRTLTACPAGLHRRRASQRPMELLRRRSSRTPGTGTAAGAARG